MPGKRCPEIPIGGRRTVNTGSRRLTAKDGVGFVRLA